MTRSLSIRTCSVELYGNGRVGGALVPLLRQKGIRISSIRDRSGICHRGRIVGRSVLVDATSPEYAGEAAEAWVARLEHALSLGKPVVTCNKAPLALAWDRLIRAARRGGTTISCSASVGGGTPILLLLARLHRSQRVRRVEASLNATLSHVCDRVSTGASISLAVEEARHTGIAEPDPSIDLDGTDAYAKSVIIHNLLFTDRNPLRLDSSRPRLDLDERTILHFTQSSLPPRVVSEITPGAIDVALAAAPEMIARSAGRPAAAIRATLNDGSRTTLTGPGAGPLATAGALLADVLEIAELESRVAEGVLP